jgi:hypothetical protein
MHRTGVCAQLLFLIDRLGRLTPAEHDRLLRSAEAIARARGSHVLGMRHLLIAAARWIEAGEVS